MNRKARNLPSFFYICNMEKEIMLHKKNNLTNDWLCWIPGTSHAYYYSTKKNAKEFCDKVNLAFEKGELSFGGDGKLIYDKK